MKSILRRILVGKLLFLSIYLMATVENVYTYKTDDEWGMCFVLISFCYVLFYFPEHVLANEIRSRLDVFSFLVVGSFIISEWWFGHYFPTEPLITLLASIFLYSALAISFYLTITRLKND